MTAASSEVADLRPRWFAPAIFKGKRPENELLAAFLGSEPGTFVEVGANDPVLGSQTWRLEQAGWSGLLVEPLSEHASRLRAFRSAKVAEVVCSAPEHDGSTLTLHVAGPRGLQSSLGAFETPGTVEEEARAVPAKTLDTLLREHAIESVDFLSVDVEGWEINVLRGFSIQKYQPRLVFLEDRVRNLRVHRHMRRHRYRLVRRTGQNAWYVPKSCRFHVSPRGRLQLFKKYYLSLPQRRLKLKLERMRRGESP